MIYISWPKRLLVYETLSGDEIRDLILKNVKILQDHLKTKKRDKYKETSALDV